MKYKYFFPWVAKHGQMLPHKPGDGRPFLMPPEAVEVGTGINEARRAHGLTLLENDWNLSRAAQEHAQDMADRDYFDHNTLDGWTWAERIRRYYPTGSLGECIAAGYRLPASVVTAWMESPPHKAIMLARDYAKMGVGYAEGPGRYVRYWTLDLGGI